MSCSCLTQCLVFCGHIPKFHLRFGPTKTNTMILNVTRFKTCNPVLIPLFTVKRVCLRGLMTWVWPVVCGKTFILFLHYGAAFNSWPVCHSWNQCAAMGAQTGGHSRQRAARQLAVSQSYHQKRRRRVDATSLPDGSNRPNTVKKTDAARVICVL